MKWRIMPSINLQRISATKCLLFGAGTLGAHVARSLMGWGVRHITFVDYGTVSYSNPVRQPLYTFDDAVQGLPKAVTAAKALESIFPSINAQGLSLSIPMPGHFESRESLFKNAHKVKELMQDHDVSFLLTDSRESRWFPTLLGSVLKKPVITAALGFDTFVVMRHGLQHSGLGCYFCNDVVAPGDSMRDRTLDQQCTVSRPGLSGIASSLAIEMMVNVVSSKNGFASSEKESCEMGSLPHQLRGFLGQFQTLEVAGRPFDKCVACSSGIVEAYHKDPTGFLEKAIGNPSYLESVSGLEELHAQTDDINVDWDESL